MELDIGSLEEAVPVSREGREADAEFVLPLPEPTPNKAAYDRERRLRLESSPACRANYQTYMNSGRRGAEVDYLPIKLDIENVSRCNFRCTMCQVSEWHRGQRAEDMSLDDFKRLIDEQVGLVEIKLQGMGEPSLAGDTLFDMIRYARERHIWVRTVTNASLLHLKDNYRKYIDADVNELQISIDGADKQTFEAIRRGSVFDRVADNCRLINDYCRDRGVERTKMWTVVQQSNCHQLFDLVDFASRAGFTSQVFSLDMTDWGQQDWKDRNSVQMAEESIDDATAQALVEKGERLGVRVAFWKIGAKYATDAPENLCPWPFERSYITSDMRTVPCCMIANPDAFEIGAGGARYGEVWRGAAYTAFRAAHLAGDIPAVCRDCYGGCGGGD